MDVEKVRETLRKIREMCTDQIAGRVQSDDAIDWIDQEAGILLKRLEEESETQ